MTPFPNLCLLVPTRVGGVAPTRDGLKEVIKYRYWREPSTWHMHGVHLPATGTKARYRVL